MTKIKIYPYKQGSASAGKLANALGGRVLKTEGSAYRPSVGDFVINWGSSMQVTFLPAQVLNDPLKVAMASNKRSAFLAMEKGGVRIPRYALNKAGVCWTGLTVCRHKLTGHSGEGIELAQADKLPDAPLYVEYIKKEDEYRVHIVGDEVVLVQRKARDRSVENPNWQIRNHANGFVFVRNDVVYDPSVVEQAKLALKALELDFGAVDVIFNVKEGKAYVLEVNTAPGMEGTTVEDYASAFRNYIKSRGGKIYEGPLLRVGG